MHRGRTSTTAYPTPKIQKTTKRRRLKRRQRSLYSLDFHNSDCPLNFGTAKIVIFSIRQKKTPIYFIGMSIFLWLGFYRQPKPPNRPPIFCGNCRGISSQLSRSCVSVVTIYCDNCHTSWTGDRETTATYWAKGQDTRNGRAAGSEQHGYKRNAGKYILLRKPKKRILFIC